MASALPRVVPATTGLPLNELLAGSLGRMPVDVVLGIVSRVGHLLERAHALGNVHGALSAFAVWASLSGEVWLEWHPHRGPVHRSLPPEVRQGEDPRPAADIYALGAVAYELLTGLSISRAWAKAPLVHLQDVASPRQFNPGVPPQVDAIVSQALSRHPADRPESIAELTRAASGAIGWEGALAALVGDPFFAPAVRELPVTCERAGAALPLPELSPAPRLVPAAVAPVVTPAAAPEASPAERAVSEPPPPSSMPMVKVMIASLLAAAACLVLTMRVTNRGGDEGGLGARASVALAHAPLPVAAPAPAVEAVPAVEPSVAEPPAKVRKAKPGVKRGKASHAKRKAR